jgi:23S rRNA (cytidine1920-2'-O)/16S rRNA (cytidine1409-2'-O)-methyltransferase
LKKRLDILLTERDFFASREKAKAAVMAGLVRVEGQICDKPGTQLDEDTLIELIDNPCPFVSRGGLKLQRAIDTFDIQLSGSTCMDIGSSTGGFTDCMLQAGADIVYAVDVGYGQLDYRLRMDKRVVVLERTNIRYLAPESVPVRFDFISIDVSFISLRLVLPVVTRLLLPKGQCLCLVKPQFEAGRKDVGKKGIVRDKDTHISTISAVMSHAQDNELTPIALTHSPITGAKGNIEFLLLLTTEPSIVGLQTQDVEAAVMTAHAQLMTHED